MKYLLFVILILFSCSSKHKDVVLKKSISQTELDHVCRLSKITFDGKLYMDYEYDEALRLVRINRYEKEENKESYFLKYDKNNRISLIEKFIFIPDKYDKIDDDFFSIKNANFKFEYIKNTDQIDMVKCSSGYIDPKNLSKKVKLKYSDSYFYAYDSKFQIIEIQQKKKKKSKKGSRVTFEYDERSNPISTNFFSISSGDLLFQIKREFDNSPRLEFDFGLLALDLIPSKNMILSHSRRVFEAYHENYSGEIVENIRWDYEYNEYGLVEKVTKESQRQRNEKITSGVIVYKYEYLCEK